MFFAATTDGFNFAIISITRTSSSISTFFFKQTQIRIQDISRRCSPLVGYFASNHDQWRTTHNVRIHERVVLLLERRVQQTTSNKNHICCNFQHLRLHHLQQHSRSVGFKFKSIASRPRLTVPELRRFSRPDTCWAFNLRIFVPYGLNNSQIPPDYED